MKDRPVTTVLGELNVAPDPYTVRLLEGVSAHETAALATVSAHLIDWDLDRLALLDRLILVLATTELMLDVEPPTAVVLDEAVELAKTYSTDSSPGFVNGVLSAVAAEVRG